MDIGTGIAVAGVWIFVGAAWLSKEVSGFGMLLAFCGAVAMTIFLK